MHLNDFGGVFSATIVDAAGKPLTKELRDPETVVEFDFRRPGGVKVTRTATVVDVRTGLVQWLVEAGFFDTEGPWLWQPHVYRTGVFEFRADPAQFIVDPNL